MKYRCRPMTEEDMPLVMEWRMQPDITRFMNTNPKLTLEGQLRWLEKIRKDDRSMYWIVEVDGEPVGVASVNDIDFVNETCSKGVYIGVKEKRTMELFAALYCSQYEFIFSTLKMNKVETEVFAENVFVVELNKRIGNIQEGYLRQHVKKEGKYYDIVRFGMLREEWVANQAKIKYPPMEIITDGYVVMEKLRGENK